MIHYIYTKNKFANILLKEATDLFASEIPMFMNRGNHEHRGREATTYINRFSTPTEKPVYTFRHGPIFFIALDSGESRPDTLENTCNVMLSDDYRKAESEWLKEILQNDDCKNAAIRIVLSHIPFYKDPDWHGGNEMNRLMVPLLNETKIDLAICADTHKYHFHEKGSFGCDFPILVNGICELTEVVGNSKSIDIFVYGPKRQKRHRINSRK